MRSVHCPDAPHSITISVEKHAGVHVSVGVDVEILLASGHAWEWIPPERYGFAARWLLLIVGSAGSAAAFGGLIQSRLSDYRWRALYIMGLTVLIECAIYALLRGLCRDGCTEQYEGKVSDGPTRKYYHITVTGKTKRDKLLHEWRRLRDTLTVLGIE